MRRFLAFVFIVAVLALAGGLSAQPPVAAQEATPAADMMFPEGVTFEPVAFAIGAELMN